MISKFWNNKIKLKENISAITMFFTAIITLSIMIKVISVILSIFSNYPYLNTCIAISSTIIVLISMGNVFKFTEIISSCLPHKCKARQNNVDEELKE